MGARRRATRPLIADLHSDTRGVYAANIGARMLRAIAQHPSTCTATRRVAWSRFDDLEVAQDLAPWTHAFAAFRMRELEHLARAIAHACSSTPAGFAAFPGSRTLKEREDLVTEALADLVNDPLSGDALICMRLVQQVPRAQIDRELRESRAERSSVTAFLQRIMKGRDLVAAGDAHGRIRLLFGAALAMDRVPDPVQTEVCDQALHYRSKLVRDRPHDHRATNWLTEEEDALLASFLALYAPAGTAHANAQNSRLLRIGEILGGPFEEDEPHPDWTAAKDAAGLTDADLSYALWTMADVGLDR